MTMMTHEKLTHMRMSHMRMTEQVAQRGAAIGRWLVRQGEGTMLKRKVQGQKLVGLWAAGEF